VAVAEPGNWRVQGRIDFVVHVGDYIYEGGPSSSPVLPGRVHSGTSETFTVDDYRTRYAQYRLDPDLQDAHANHPSSLRPTITRSKTTTPA
jgi:alkaline phosphatase D